MNAIKAAFSEQRGEGAFTLKGRKIEFRRQDGMVFNWYARTDADAAQQLRIFRAAPKHIVEPCHV